MSVHSTHIYPEAPYLRGVPQLSGRLAELASHPSLRPEQEAELDAAIAKLLPGVRAARQSWLRQQA